MSDSDQIPFREVHRRAKRRAIEQELHHTGGKQLRSGWRRNAVMRNDVSKVTVGMERDIGFHHTCAFAQQPVVEGCRHPMIGTVDSISLSYSGTGPVVPLKDIFDGWLPHLLWKTHGMEKYQRQIFILAFILLCHRASVLMHEVALGCDVIWVGRSRRADDRLYKHCRKRRVWGSE